LGELLGNSAVFTDIMVGGPAMGDTQSQEGGYNASLKNKAEAAARGETGFGRAVQLFSCRPVRFV
jgi:hypothetical protein